MTYARDASNGLSFEKLQAYINTNHPRIEIVDTNSGIIQKVPFTCCYTRTGSYSCCKSIRESDFNKYGTGVVAYF